ncbi:MAG: hypothetical protein R2874_06945 [Desulfobacterales bacterium]
MKQKNHGIGNENRPRNCHVHPLGFGFIFGVGMLMINVSIKSNGMFSGTDGTDFNPDSEGVIHL